MTSNLHSRPFVDAAVVTTAATALVALIGIVREGTYFGRLGIQMSDLRLPIEHFMTASFSILLYPIFFFVLYIVAEAALREGGEGPEAPGHPKTSSVKSWGRALPLTSLWHDLDFERRA